MNSSRPNGRVPVEYVAAGDGFRRTPRPVEVWPGRSVEFHVARREAEKFNARTMCHESLPMSRRRAPKQNLLVYRDGDRAGTAQVRRQYLLWRASQTPSLPERCDNDRCVFHTQPLDWNGGPLKLILDHRNGVNTDNRPSNLRLLCPNCDSQISETRGGANRGRVRKAAGGFGVKAKTGLWHYTLPVESGRYQISLQHATIVSGKPESDPQLP